MPTKTKKKKSKKMDPALVAAKQRQEVSYISKKFNIPMYVVRDVIKDVGRSRAKIYAALRGEGWEIPTRKYAKKSKKK